MSGPDPQPGTTYESFTPSNRDFDEITLGYEVVGEIGASVDDATVRWWVMAKDVAGNVGFSDRLPTDENNQNNPCTATAVAADPSDSFAERQITALKAAENCQAYSVFVDGTSPSLHAAVTGRHWNVSQTGISKSNDKTDYRAAKAKKNQVLAIFSEHLDPTTVTASDFRVANNTPRDADVRNVTVREDTDGDKDKRRGYVFLTLNSDLDPDATPKVELVGEIMDLAGNDRDDDEIDLAKDGIAPTLTVEIDEGARAVTKDSVNLTITADEDIKSTSIEYALVLSSGLGDDKAKMVGQAFPVGSTSVTDSKRTATISPSGVDDGLYSIMVTAADSAGNVGEKGDVDGEIDVTSETKAILFEFDTMIADIDVDPDKSGKNDKFTTDDVNTYIRIDFSAEAKEYDLENVRPRQRRHTTKPKSRATTLDTHWRHGGPSCLATLDSPDGSTMDITDDLQANDCRATSSYYKVDRPR